MLLRLGSKIGVKGFSTSGFRKSTPFGLIFFKNYSFSEFSLPPFSKLTLKLILKLTLKLTLIFAEPPLAAPAPACSRGGPRLQRDCLCRCRACAEQRLGYEHPFLGSSMLILVMIFNIIINDNILTDDDNNVSLLYRYSGY